MALTFNDLTTVPTQKQVVDQEVVPQLVANGVAVTSWVLGGVYRGLVQAVAYMRRDARTSIATMVCAGFEDYVFGRVAAPGGIDVTSWAPFVAKQRYGLLQKPATYTRRTLTLTNTSTNPYPNVQPGRMIVRFPSGNRYVLDEVTSVPAATGPSTPGVVTAAFRSDFPYTAGATYNTDPPGSTIALITTSFPGVTVTNPAPTYSPVAQAGSGIGGLIVTGTPVSSPHQVTVQIIATGNVADGTAKWQTSLDGGPFVMQTGSSVSNLSGAGINITLADNGGNPSFVVGTYYFFSTPGSDITQVGAIAETPQSLGQRVAGLWPLLAFTTDRNGNFVPPASPTEAAYVTLALSANQNVVVAFIFEDPTVNNLLRLCIAGQGGASLPPAVIASEQAFFQSLNMLSDRIAVQTPNPRPVMLGLSSGAIQAKASMVASAQQAMQQRVAAYLGGTDPAQPLNINGLIDYEYLAALIRTTPGVTKVPSNALTISTSGSGPVSTDVQLPITAGAIEVAQFSQSLASAFPWQAS